MQNADDFLDEGSNVPTADQFLGSASTSDHSLNGSDNAGTPYVAYNAQGQIDPWKTGGGELVRSLATAGGGLWGVNEKLASGIRGTAAGVNSLFNGGDFSPAYDAEYDKSLKNIRQTQKEFTQEHPGWATEQKLSAGLVGNAPLAALATAPAGTSILGQMARAGDVFIPTGLASGYISADGTPSDKALGAAKGAAEYGIPAMLAPSVFGALGWGAGKAWDAGKAAVNSSTNLLKDWFDPEGQALRQIGEAMRTDAPEISPADFIQKVKGGLTPAEAGGSNIEAMADRIAQNPGSARPIMAQLFQNRIENQGQQIPDIIKNALGSEGEGTNAIELLNQAKKNIAPLAAKAFQPAQDVTSAVGADPVIQRLISNPDVANGIPRGIQIIRNEADAAGEPFNAFDYGIKELNPGVEETSAIDKVPNMRLIDAAKRGLDAQINENSNEFGQLNPLGRSQFLLKKALVDRAKTLNPDYANYLDNAADQYSLGNAAKIGRGIWNTSNKEETITQLNALSQPEKQMALNGAVRGIIEQIERRPDTANQAITNLGKKYYRDLLEPLVPEGTDVRELSNQLRDQAQLFARNRTWLQQSRTALRQSTDEGGGVLDFVKNLPDKILNREGVGQAKASILLNQNPQNAAQQLLQAYNKTNNFTPFSFAPPQPQGIPFYRYPLLAYTTGVQTGDRQ